MNYLLEDALGNDRKWDIAALFFIFFIVLTIWFRKEIFPVFMDIYYHLSVAEMFRQAGGITTIDFLQFAPNGRIHLYPPLYHALLSLLLRFGVPVQILSKMASAITYPVLVLVTYFISSRIYSGRIGFLSLLLLSISSMFFMKTAYLSTSMTAVILCLLAYYSIHKKSYVSATAFMVLSLYTHVSIPHIFIFPFLVIAILDKEERKCILLSVIISYAVYLPYIWHIASNFGYLNTIEAISTNVVDILLLLLAFMGSFILLRQYAKVRKDNVKLYPVILAIVLCVVYPLYPHRFWFHLYVPLAILGSIGIDGILMFVEDRHPKLRAASTVLVVAIMISLAFSFQPVYVFNSYSLNYKEDVNRDHGILLDERGLYFKKSLFNVLINAYDNSSHDRNYIDQDFYGIAKNIILKTDKDDIILIENGGQGCFLTALTGRGSTNGMFREIEPYDSNAMNMPLTKAYVLSFIPSDLPDGVTAYPENEYSLIIRDRDDVAKIVVPEPVVGLWKFCFLSLLFLVLGLSVFFRKR